MEATSTLSQLIFTVYIPFIIAFISLAVPMVGILLSVFAQGREEVSRIHQEEISKITQDIKVNESSRQRWVIKLFWQLLVKRYKLLILNPNYYLPLLVIPPVFSIVFAVLALSMYFKFFIITSLILLVLFQILMWSLIKLIADATLLRDNKKEERERVILETLQGILKNTDPQSLRVKDCHLTIDREKVKDGDVLPVGILGRELSWKITFCNSETQISANKTEIGFQFPKDAFEIKKQNGYNVYERDNIVRFESEYIQKKTNLNYSTPLIVIPKRTGVHKIAAWLKGENVTPKYINLTITIETEI
ncbi:MAG: hypothetical protein WCW47_01635 [Candidatus Paceibacterota bacterium]|jgi:hypothetical protein